MTYNPFEGTYEYIDEQLGFPHQAAGHRPKKVLPGKDIVADWQAQRQAEARARQRNYFRPNPGTAPDALLRVRQRPDDDDEPDTRPPRSAVRYQPETWQSGNTRVNFSYQSPPPVQQMRAVPPRRSAQTVASPAPQREHDMYTDDVAERETPRPRILRQKPKLYLHWLVFVGVGLLLMLAGYMAFTDIGAWWQTRQDDAAFGNPRTYQVDAVVGHGDSNTNPSHFIALNLKGEIVVIEIPGGNGKNARSYPITTLPGNQSNPPVRLVFQDFDHDGRLDMLVQIGDPPTTITYMLFNNGTQFVGKS